MDVEAQWVLLQPISIGRRLHYDGEDRAPAFGGGQCIVHVVALGPCDPKTIVRRTNNAGNLDGNLRLADLAEWIIDPGIVIERECAPLSVT